jgi:predicted phosphate transport protein (TIGR00153 family)
MLRWFQALMPREDRFFGLFNLHARTLVDGSAALAELLHARASVPDATRRVMDFENQADVIARDVLTLTRRSFITPFDRSDIKELITALDDAIDQMQKTAKAIILFEVSGFETQMAQMGDIIVDAAKLTVDAVALLGSMRQQSVRLNAITEEIIRLEENADGLHDLGIKELYGKYRSRNAMDYIVGTEIYDHLERVMDRFEDVANCISGIAIEQA